jgi:hypothetical protein
MTIGKHSFDNQLTTQTCLPTATTNLALPNVQYCSLTAFYQTPSVGPVVACRQCQSGYVLSAEASNTFSCQSATDANKPNIANCKVYDNVNAVCLTCSASNYGVLNGLCTAWTQSTLTSINCDVLDFPASKTSASWKCLTCSWGYSLVNGDCAATSTANTIPNCAKADVNGVCSVCSNGYVLISSGGSPECFRVYTQGTPTTGSTTDFDPHCLVLNSDSFNNLQIECLTCASGMLPAPRVSGPADYCISFHTFDGISNCVSFPTPTAVSNVDYSCVQCSDVSAKFIDATSRQCITRVNNNPGDPNCSLVSPNADSCQQCAAGYKIVNGACQAIPQETTQTVTSPATVGSAAYRTFLANVRGYMDDCSATVADCDPTVFYNGLDTPLTYFFSCHKCQTAGKIPFAYVHAGNTTFSGVSGLFSWGVNATNAPLGWYSDGVAIACQTPVATSFHATALTGKFTFPLQLCVGYRQRLVRARCLARQSGDTC